MKKWTIIIQINAENNLIYDSIKAFNELGKFGSTKDVDYIVLFDGLDNPRYPHAPLFPAAYRMTRGMRFRTAKPKIKFGKAEEQLADPLILKRVLSQIKKKFPAKNYGFIYKGHGGAGGTDISNSVLFTTKLTEMPTGTERQVEKKLENLGGTGLIFEGYCLFSKDKNLILAVYSNAEGSECLTYKGLAGVLAKVFTINQLGFVCLDCCWGQQVEHAYSFRKATRHFVASVDEMPSLGLGYSDFCRYLNERPGVLSYELANILVAVYFVRNYDDYDSPIVEFRKMGVSLTCVNTYRFKKYMSLFNEICHRLIRNMKQHRPVIKKALKCCKDYTYDLDRDDYAVYNLDLIWLMENIMHFNETDPQLNQSILEFIRYHMLYYIRGFMGNNYKNPTPGKQFLGGRGVSIAFPRNLDELENSIYFKDDKPDFVRYSQWTKMLNAFFKPRAKKAALAAAPAARGIARAPLKRAMPVIIEEKIGRKWGRFHAAKFIEKKPLAIEVSE